MEVTKQAYKVELLVNVASVNLDNIDVKFNSLSMYNEDEDNTIQFSGREYNVSKERHNDGILVKIYIVNDSEVLTERMDCLVDEEYYISNVDANITKISTGEILSYTLVSPYGEQTNRDFELVLRPELGEVYDYLADFLTEGNKELKDIIFKTLDENTDLVDYLKTIKDIPIF